MAIQEDASHLPNDILETILSRLPVKSLLRFKSVSKSWNTMISDPRFVRIHHQSSMNSDSHNLFLRESSERWLSLVRLEGRKFRTERPDSRWNYVLCVGEGVVLLSCTDWDYKTYLLWNPCSRQETMFRFPYRIDSDAILYGLCHDPDNEDFKVVIISDKLYAVFSCKNRSWTKKKEFPYHKAYSGVTVDAGISADGAVYWVWYDDDKIYQETEIYGTKCTYDLLCFDPRDDSFKILQKPENVKDSAEFFLMCLKGCLSLYCNAGGDEKTVQIWIKDKGGQDRCRWKVLMNIENLPKPVKLLGLLPFVENKIVIDLDGKRFLIYNPFEKTYEEFEESEASWSYLYPCLDSMFFPIMKTRPKRKRSGHC